MRSMVYPTFKFPYTIRTLIDNIYLKCSLCSAPSSVLQTALWLLGKCKLKVYRSCENLYNVVCLVEMRELVVLCCTRWLESQKLKRKFIFDVGGRGVLLYKSVCILSTERQWTQLVITRNIYQHKTLLGNE